VNTLIADLASSDPATRERAAIRLEFMPDPTAIEPLIALLDDPENRVQIAAAGALGAIGDAGALSSLMRMFAGDTYLTSNGGDSPEQYFRIVRAAALALAMIALHSPDSYETIFWTFLQRLAWHDADQSPHLRAEAAAGALGLGILRDGRAKSVLFEAAQYGAGRVKDAVIQSLGDLGDRDAIPMLVTALQTSTSYGIVGLAAESLAQLRDFSAISLMIAIAESDMARFIVDVPHRQQARMRYVAGRAIRLHIGRALAWLSLDADADTNAQIKAIWERWLIHRETTLREAAAVGLAIRRDGRGFDELMRAFAHKDDDALPILFFAIETLGDPRALPDLDALVASGHASPYALERARRMIGVLGV
jgi:HEAT repeat protein